MSAEYQEQIPHVGHPQDADGKHIVLVVSWKARMKIQAETGWDLGPFAAGLQCLHLDTPLSSSNEIQRNYMALKITTGMRSWGKLWTKRYKRPKLSTATSAELGAKTGCLEQKQGTAHAPCIHHLRGGQNS